MAMNKRAALATEDQQQASLMSSFFLTGHLALISYHQSKSLYILLLDRHMNQRYGEHTEHNHFYVQPVLDQAAGDLPETCRSGFQENRPNQWYFQPF